MANTIISIKSSDVPSATPAPANLANGELALNFADGKLFFKAANGSVLQLNSGDNFATINANGTLVVADSPGDIVTLLPGDNITIVGDAVNDRVTFSANIGPAYDKANAAFNQANASNTFPVGNTSGGTFVNRFFRNGLNFVAGTNVTINVDDYPSENKANITITSTATGVGASVAVTDSAPPTPAANTLWWSSTLGKMFIYYNDGTSSQWVESSPGLVSANGTGSGTVGDSGAHITANAAFDKANAANATADSTYTYAANNVQLIANSAFDKANLSYTFAANNAFLVGNSAYAAANTTWTYTANTVQLIANTAYGAANTTYTYAANNVMLAANSAFAYANGVNTNTFTALATAIAAYGQANTDWTYAANNVQLIANSAYAGANSTYTYAANTVMLAANSAFNRANIANLQPVGNTMANDYYTIGSSRNQLNMIPGGDWISINVNDDATLNTANVIVTANLTGAFTQANLAWDKANVAYTFAANNAFLVGNSAYGAANTTWTYAANNVQLIANSAFAGANSTYTYAANTVQLIANSAYAGANSTYTYAANVVMSAANAAFSQANGANLMPVGNTMANSYYATRATRRRINFVPGTNVTINVDDDPTLNTANVTISASVTGGDPSFAFDRANTANLRPVGNTMSNGYYTIRSTRNQLNLIPGSNITINVDDDPTLNTANVTITSTATGGGGVAVSAVPPASPTANNLWWNSDNGTLYVYYNDGTSSQWVETDGGPGPGTININEREIDFGSSPVYEKRFAISDANVTTNTIVVATQSMKAATGKSSDENEADSLILSAYANNGYVLIYARAIPGPVIGTFIINYYTK